MSSTGGESGVFERVVCGVDGSDAGFEALSQARRLLAPGGRLLAAALYDPGQASRAGWSVEALLAELEQAAEETRREAELRLAGLEDAEARVDRGSPAQRLIELVREEQATLVAVGGGRRSRAAGILMGGVATRLLHEAPCAVLVARATVAPATFPSAIVVGLDGSAESLAALATGRELSSRFGASLRALTATGGKPVDVDGLAKVERCDWSELAPVDALAEASEQANLLVVGSRGLHGVAALGSVSERVAHRAACSVLVLRGRDSDGQ